MGNANQATPACIVRDHKLTFSDFNGWVPAIAPEEDLFKGIL
jgi:F420-0:gamma-glutamyl ligase